MAQLYANENFPLPVVEALRHLGHDVLTSAEAGNAGRAVPDGEVLAFAARQRRTLLTLNRKHFIRLHQESSAHAGIIVCTFDSDFVGQATRVDTQLRALVSAEGELVRVNRPNPG